MKLNKEDKMLIEEAKKAIGKIDSSKFKFSTGEVGCALIAEDGKIYTGINMDFYCGLGTCAEYQAVASMIGNGENHIKKIVAIHKGKLRKNDEIIVPCGRCREMIHQISEENWVSEVIVSNSKKVKLKELLPYAWGHTIGR